MQSVSFSKVGSIQAVLPSYGINFVRKLRESLNGLVSLIPFVSSVELLSCF